VNQEIADFGCQVVAQYAVLGSYPTVECPGCQKLVSPPERLAVHFSRCSSGRRSSVLKQTPNTGLGDDVLCRKLHR
jgi:hypothetical protein